MGRSKAFVSVPRCDKMPERQRLFLDRMVQVHRRRMRVPGMLAIFGFELSDEDAVPGAKIPPAAAFAFEGVPQRTTAVVELHGALPGGFVNQVEAFHDGEPGRVFQLWVWRIVVRRPVL